MSNFLSTFAHEYATRTGKGPDEIRNDMTSLTYFYLAVGFVVAIAIVYNLIAMHRDNREAKY